MDIYEFVTRAVMIIASFFACALCINGFISKVLDKKVDPAARFALGFFIIVSGMLFANSNFVGSNLNILDTPLELQSAIRGYLAVGILLTIQAMLANAPKMYWWVVLLFTVLGAAAAFLSFPYL